MNSIFESLALRDLMVTCTRVVNTYYQVSVFGCSLSGLVNGICLMRLLADVFILRQLLLLLSSFILSSHILNLSLVKHEWLLWATRALVHWMQFLELELINKLWVRVYFILRLQWCYSLRLTWLQLIWLLAWEHAMSLINSLHLGCLAVNNPICTSDDDVLLLLLLASQGLLVYNTIEVSAVFHLNKLAPMRVHKGLLRRSRLLTWWRSLTWCGRRTDSTSCICRVVLV